PDELLYSQLARYYYKSGYMAYIFAAEDLFESRWVRPDIEFVNSYTQNAYGVITKNLSQYEVMIKHTMFPYYGRFLDKERRNKAFSALVNMQGGYRNLLAIPKTNKARYLRYCPLCVSEDRQKYGEAYWHRIHQMIGVDACPIHFCSLINSDILISSKASPRFVTAEEAASENCGYTVNYNDTEKRLYQYISTVFKSDVNLENDVQVGDYLSYRLQNTKYMTGKMRNMKALTYDYNEFYGTETELWRIEKVLTNDDFKHKNICMLAMFLNITPEELCNPSLPESVWKRNRKVEYKFNKPGIKTKNWAEIDDETLHDIQQAIEKLLGSDPPKRVTVYAVEQMLKLPSKQIEHLPKCKNEILKHYESQEEFWARKVSWAVEKITEEEQSLNWKHIRDLTNMRKQNLSSCMPYLNSELREKIELIL
ncbi:MAG: TniQ family protein, partial [Eubacteriales bacterium]|nr:TniQ family protein [Eubacteriales bacterium]